MKNKNLGVAVGLVLLAAVLLFNGYSNVRLGAEINNSTSLRNIDLQNSLFSLAADDVAIANGVGQTATGTVSWNPGAVANEASTSSPAITVSGAAAGDFVLVSTDYATTTELDNFSIFGQVTAADTVRIHLGAHTTTTLTGANWYVRVLETVPAALQTSTSTSN